MLQTVIKQNGLATFALNGQIHIHGITASILTHATASQLVDDRENDTRTSL